MIGWIVGEPGKGMAAMFTMMNGRVSVGIQGLGVGEAAYQAAAGMRKIVFRVGRLRNQISRSGSRSIIVHPDVRRMLMTMQALASWSAGRSAWVSCARLDAEKHSPQTGSAPACGNFIALMTPVVKALFTDNRVRQREPCGPMLWWPRLHPRKRRRAIYARDARITMIYEGTNGVQALDLVGHGCLAIWAAICAASSIRCRLHQETTSTDR
jgi:alkylation response protein AidB-like acyl-CoA dehydrogenase